ncbi:hypothetical protein [Lysinibacillus zambalensis]|uniref:hypothetical protein n=1 Tax=Lysinibacillus zambalensis TaxID=3160866 RepID=UPI0032E3EA52
MVEYFFGEDSPYRSKNHNTYPKELKRAAVQDYISGSYGCGSSGVNYIWQQCAKVFIIRNIILA